MSSSSSSSPEIPAATASYQARFSYKDSTHEEVLEELSSRFILNLPDDELASLERICFQVEQAHWFYEDFIREENPKFPSLPLKKFSAMLFHACPLLHQWSHDHEQAFNTFMQYKTRVPVCGAIMLNDTWEKCVLVKGWKSSSGWGFPKGKINEDELPYNCAIREVLEETGYNLAGQINTQDVIEMSIKEQKISLYIVPGVPEDFPFKTKTRKEISKIEWFKLTDLPTWRRNKASPGRFYLISPFIGALKNFINERKPRNPKKVQKLRKQQINQLTYPQTTQTNVETEKQESSSQSSSAENGDPQTPSPHYTEPAINSIPRIESNAIDASMDPHMARLLSTLTLSASTPVTNELGLNGNAVDINTLSSKESRTPVPIVTPPTHQAENVPTVQSLSNQQTAFTPSQGNHVLMSNPLSSPHADVGRTFHRTPLLAAMEALSPTLSTVSSHLPTSRRTSSTADISPYLSRPPEIPTSAKKLKQLALLEAVADESAKITPLLAARNAVTANNSPGYDYPLPPSSVPPQMMPRDLYNTNNVYNPNNFGLKPVPPMHSSFNGNAYMQGSHIPQDPFQIRSQTSQSFRRYPMQAPYGSASMNQTQLLTLINGSRSLVGTRQGFQQPPASVGQMHSAPYESVATGPLFPGSLAASQATGSIHSQSPFISQPHTSHSMRANAFPDFSPSTVAAPSTTSLLSILNGNRAGQLGAGGQFFQR